MKELMVSDAESVSGGMTLLMAAGLTALGAGVFALGAYAGYQIAQGMEPSC